MVDGKQKSAVVRQRMQRIRETAAANPAAICWWCGKRPWNNRWDADHIFALLGPSGPVLAACTDCNNTRRRRLPSLDKCRRAFHSDRVVRSVSKAELQHIARAESERLFRTTEWIPLLIAADKTTRPQVIKSGRHKGGVAHAETARLLEMLTERNRAVV